MNFLKKLWFKQKELKPFKVDLTTKQGKAYYKVSGDDLERHIRPVIEDKCGFIVKQLNDKLQEFDDKLHYGLEVEVVKGFYAGEVGELMQKVGDKNCAYQHENNFENWEHFLNLPYKEHLALSYYRDLRIKIHNKVFTINSANIRIAKESSSIKIIAKEIAGVGIEEYIAGIIPDTCLAVDFIANSSKKED